MDERTKCSICGKEITGEPAMIDGDPVCADHRQTAPGGWYMIGFYRREDTAVHRQEMMAGAGIDIMLLRSAATGGFKLLAARDRKDEAIGILGKSFEGYTWCPLCNMEYSTAAVYCPKCGTRPVKKNHMP